MYFSDFLKKYFISSTNEDRLSPVLMNLVGLCRVSAFLNFWSKKSGLQFQPVKRTSKKSANYLDYCAKIDFV